MKIKICGIFREEDTVMLNEAQPDYAGFVFVRESRRYVTPEKAAILRGQIDTSIKTVGVFRNAPPAFPASLVRAGTISAVQLHGEEDAAYIKTLRAEPELQGIPIIKAISVGSADALRTNTKESSPCDDADFLLYDNGAGGTGERFDLDILREVTAHGLLPKKPFFIAGGVNPDNIAEILRKATALAAHGIDVSGGAETSGVKDAMKIKTLVKAVKGERT